MKVRGARRGLVLAYHRVAEVDDDPFELAVAPATFARHLAAIGRVAEAVRLADVGRPGGPHVAVTIDDGYEDTLGAAVPLLEAAGVPALCYVAWGTLGVAGGMWWDRLAALLEAAPDESEPIEMHVAGTRIRLRRDDGWRRRLLWALHPRLRALDPGQIEAQLATLGGLLGVSSGLSAPRMMDAGQVLQTARSSVMTIGAHTVDHPVLAGMPEAEIAREVDVGRRRLADLVGEPVTDFAYPYGDHSAFDDRTTAVVRRLGLSTAVTTVPGRVGRWTDRLRLPRVTVTEEMDLPAVLRRWLHW